MAHNLLMCKIRNVTARRKPGRKPYEWEAEFGWLSRRTRTRIGQIDICLDVVKEK
jgi:hypothetical protein